MRLLRVSTFLALLALASAKPGAPPSPKPKKNRAPTMTIVETAVATPALSTLVAVLGTAGYEGLLAALNDEDAGPFTVFAPTDDAFSDAGVDATFAANNVALVTEVLKYHVLPARVTSRDLGPLQFPATLMDNSDYVLRSGNGQNIGVMKTSEGVKIFWTANMDEIAEVVIKDVFCTNGVVHVIDKVIMPFPADPATVATGAGLTTLVDLVVGAGLATTITETDDLTIFAPTNDAFADIAGALETLSSADITEILTYHVVGAVAFSTDLSDGDMVPTLSGDDVDITLCGYGGVAVNDAKVIVPNVITKNGVVHVIDKVLLPPKFRPAPDSSSDSDSDSDWDDICSDFDDDWWSLSEDDDDAYGNVSGSQDSSVVATTAGGGIILGGALAAFLVYKKRSAASNNPAEDKPAGEAAPSEVEPQVDV